MTEKVYDGATTALHRRIEAYQQNLSVAEQAAASAITKLGRAREWAKRWKALAKRIRMREAHIRIECDKLEGRIDMALEAVRRRPTRARIWKALAKKLRWQLKDADASRTRLHAQLDSEVPRRMAAETALASARDHLGEWLNWYKDNSPSGQEPCAAWVNTVAFMYARPDTSHPAPVAAPCAGCALLLRRLRFRNETIAFLTKSKIEFNENDEPGAAEDLLFYHWWVDVREWGRELEKRLRAEEKTNKGLRRHIRYLQLTCMMLGNRLHVKRAEAAHWQSLYRGSEMKSSPSSSPRLPGRTRGSGGC